MTTKRSAPAPSRKSSRKVAKVDYKEPGDAVNAGDETESGVAGVTSTATGSAKAYRDLLIKQKKELYKDPPVLPPAGIKLIGIGASEPVMSRNAKGDLVAKDYPEFRPNLTPAEVMQRGSFGGTYFRPIESAVTGEKYSSEVWKEYPKEWFEGLNIGKQVASSKYDPAVNKYGVKCGGSIGMWESSGWISELDPYGWFQWYCRFYQGRRTTDDERQIGRWKSGHGPKGRFRCQLMNKIIAGKTDVDCVGISPVIRQTCQHWGYCPTQADLDAHKKKKGL